MICSCRNRRWDLITVPPPDANLDETYEFIVEWLYQHDRQRTREEARELARKFKGTGMSLFGKSKQGFENLFPDEGTGLYYQVLRSSYGFVRLAFLTPRAFLHSHACIIVPADKTGRSWYRCNLISNILLVVAVGAVYQETAQVSEKANRDFRWPYVKALASLSAQTTNKICFSECVCKATWMPECFNFRLPGGSNFTPHSFTK